MKSTVEVRGLTKRYPQNSKPVFSNLDLDLWQRETVSLLGPSGCGKSTLLNILGLLECADSGVLEYHFESASPMSVDMTRSANWRLRSAVRLQRRIGIVFQHSVSLPSFTVLDNVAMPLIATGACRESARESARKVMEHMGIWPLAGRMSNEISGGERQRMAIARALVHDPVLVLADEPTGSLDADTAKKVMDHFRSALTQSGAACMLVTHDHKIARQYADRILELGDGMLRDSES